MQYLSPLLYYCAFSCFITLFLPLNTSGGIITIPTDADSIQEAVEIAISGDEIHIVTDTVEWTRTILDVAKQIRSDGKGVSIINKDITITGKSDTGTTTISVHPVATFENSNTMLHIKNSQVTLKNFFLPKPFMSRWEGYFSASPVLIESGKLNLENCELNSWFQCTGNLSIRNSTIHGYSWQSGYGYTQHLNTLEPSIQIGPSMKASIEIVNSTISSNMGDGFQNLLILGLNQSHVRISNSRLYGGVCTVDWGSYPSDMTGANGITIANSYDTQFTIEDSAFYGGKGYDATFHRMAEYYGGGQGGNGMFIKDSYITINFQDNNSSFNGGEGGKGGIGLHYNSNPNDDVVVNGGRGGDGLHLVNSTIKVNSQLVSDYAIGGQGGSGAQLNDIIAEQGQCGQSIILDQNSKIEQLSQINNWPDY
jgi:hypothetical protein